MMIIIPIIVMIIKPRRSSECAVDPGLLGDTPIVVVDVESLEGGPEDILLRCCRPDMN